MILRVVARFVEHPGSLNAKVLMAGQRADRYIIVVHRTMRKLMDNHFDLHAFILAFPWKRKECWIDRDLDSGVCRSPVQGFADIENVGLVTGPSS